MLRQLVHSVLISTFLLLPHSNISLAEFGNAPNPESEPDFDLETEEFYPETKNEKLAYAYNFTMNTNPTTIPCHLLNVRYADSFPASITNYDYPTGVATPEQYFKSKFKFLHMQQYLEGEKKYFKPVRLGFLPQWIWEKQQKDGRLDGLSEEEKDALYLEDRDKFVEKYPDGEHVGWFKYKVFYVQEPLEIERKDTDDPDYEPKHLKLYQSENIRLAAEHEKVGLPGYVPVQPIIFQKSIYHQPVLDVEIHTGPPRKILVGTPNYIHIEMCQLAGFKYTFGDYTDLYRQETFRRAKHHFNMDPLPASAMYMYDYDNELVAEDLKITVEGVEHILPPVDLGYWDTLDYYLKSEEERIASIEMTLRIAQMPAYFVPIVGTVLSLQDAIECHASGEPYCWSGFAVDAVSDVAMVLKVPAVASKIVKGVNTVINAADPLRQAIKASKKMELTITGVDKIGNLGLKVAAVSNGVLAIAYAREGMILEAVARGFSGTTDLGLLMYLKKALTVIPLRKVKPKCSSAADVARRVQKISSNIAKHAGCKIHNESYFDIGCAIKIPRITCQ